MKMEPSTWHMTRLQGHLPDPAQGYALDSTRLEAQLMIIPRTETQAARLEESVASLRYRARAGWTEQYARSGYRRDWRRFVERQEREPMELVLTTN